MPTWFALPDILRAVLRFPAAAAADVPFMNVPVPTPVLLFVAPMVIVRILGPLVIMIEPEVGAAENVPVPLAWVLLSPVLYATKSGCWPDGGAGVTQFAIPALNENLAGYVFGPGEPLLPISSLQSP